jgi:hypothetical protein
MKREGLSFFKEGCDDSLICGGEILNQHVTDCLLSPCLLAFPSVTVVWAPRLQLFLEIGPQSLPTGAAKYEGGGEGRDFSTYLVAPVIFGEGMN